MFSNDIGCYPLSKKITLFIGSILLTNIVSAHKCYFCGPNNADVFVNGELIPSCLHFNNNDSKYIKNCDENSKGCSIQTNGTLVTRACEDLPIQDCKKANNVEYCYCITDLCNLYHPAHVDEDDSEEGEGSGITSPILITDDIIPTTIIDTSTISSEPSHVTKSIPKQSNSCISYTSQADIIIMLIFSIFHIGNNLII